MTSNQLNNAYQFCLQLAQSHYENFPVASRFLPAKVRLPIAVIYAFARTADDFADEGDHTAEARLVLLNEYGSKLDAIKAGQPQHEPIFIALADVIDKHQLPLEPFYDLLHAFKQDVSKTQFADFFELADYCRYSANPIGRLLLHLYNLATPDNLLFSDAVCSALQLINFLQDIEQDLRENGRIYLPQDEMRRFSVTQFHLLNQVNDFPMNQLYALQLQRAKQMLLSGKPLGRILPGRIGFEMRLIIHGGLAIIEALEKQANPFTRPRIKRSDWLKLAWRAFWD